MAPVRARRERPPLDHKMLEELALRYVERFATTRAKLRDYLRRKRLQKPTNQKEAARVFRQLMRGGFGAKTIFAILKKWEVDDETLQALEGELE